MTIPAIANMLRMAVVGRRSSEVVDARDGTVAWRLKKNDWHSVRWCTVTEYGPGLIRFRNDLRPTITKRIWPLDHPTHAEIGQFEITFAVEELDDETLAWISELAENPKIERTHPLFEGSVHPHYAWTKGASAREKEQRLPRQAIHV